MTDQDRTRELILKAISLTGGTQASLARKIGGKCRQGHVFKWLQVGRVTGEVAVQIEVATGGAITRADLRPELFLAPTPAASAADQQQAA